MPQIRTDLGTFGSDKGVVGRASAMTAQDVTALTGAGVQTETSATADAPSGDSTNGFSSTNDKATAVACINRNKVRIAEHRVIIAAAVVRIGELDALQVKILARVKEIEDILEDVGLVTTN